MADGHLSLYQLTIELLAFNFIPAMRVAKRWTAPDNAAAPPCMNGPSNLSAAGLPAYEVSNHAKTGNESRHNLAYWHYDDYIGIGPGAHGRYQEPAARRFATEDHRSPDVWLAQVNKDNHGLRLRDEIDPATAQREALMMGLRLASGIEHAKWQKKFGMPLVGDDALLGTEKIQRPRAGKLSSQRCASDFKATTAGLQRLNAVLDYLLN